MKNALSIDCIYDPMYYGCFHRKTTFNIPFCFNLGINIISFRDVEEFHYHAILIGITNVYNKKYFLFFSSNPKCVTLILFDE